MIIIFTEKDDFSTIRCLEYLDSFNVDRCIVYSDTKFELLSVTIGINSDFEFLIDGLRIKYSELKGLWYRRGYLPNLWTFNIDFQNYPEKFKKAIYNERSVLRQYVIYKFNLLPHINKLGLGNVNKLVMLDKAIEAKLTVPNTLITRKYEKIRSFFGSQKVITKSMGNGLRFIENYVAYWQGTMLVDIGGKKELIDNSSFSLYQNCLEKKYEIRIFHLFGENYSMAIVSQTNDRTKVDYRNYDNENPNRNVPYQLPVDISDKINVFMKNIDMVCGSIDMVVTKENEYVFLEVNPVGQYNPLVVKCNYNIDKLIAEKLKSFNDG